MYVSCQVTINTKDLLMGKWFSAMGKWIYVIPFPHEQIFNQPPDAISQPPDATLKKEIKVMILQPPDATFHCFNIMVDNIKLRFLAKYLWILKTY